MYGNIYTPVITLSIDFVPYNPINSNDVKLGFCSFIFKYSIVYIAENYINVSNKEPFFDYYEVRDNFGRGVIKAIIKPFGLYWI